MEQLEGYTASLASSTGKSGSEIGTAIKSIISRLYRIGSEGESSAGKAEEALQGIGVAVRNADGEFRDFDNILKDIRDKWDGLTNITKQNIAQTIAGKYVPESTVTYLRKSVKSVKLLVA